MFKINDTHARTDAEKLKPDTDKAGQFGLTGKFSWKYLVDIGIVLVMATILFWGASSQFSNR